MHEYSLVSALLNQVEAEARKRGATSVRSVRVELGQLAGVDPGLFATAWDTFRERTICAEASLEIVHVAARWECLRCNAPIASGGLLQCAACAGPARLVQGDELLLASLDVEVPGERAHV